MRGYNFVFLPVHELFFSHGKKVDFSNQSDVASLQQRDWRINDIHAHCMSTIKNKTFSLMFH